MSRPFPFFSICIPNFNYAHYIGITIQSILDQSWPHFEIIVADNASIDNSIEVVNSFDDPRIKLIRNPLNIGFAPNLDRATETATGDYIILVSSDDTLKLGALEAYAKIIQSYGDDSQNLVLSSSLDIINGQGSVIGQKPVIAESQKKIMAKLGRYPLISDEEKEIYFGYDLLTLVFQGSLSNIGKFVSTCYSKTLYDKVGGYRSTMSVIPDAQFSQKLMFHNPIVIFILKPLFQYRIHSTNFYSQIFNHVLLYCDKYKLTQTYSNSDLSPLGITNAQLKKNFTRHWCINRVLISLLKGKTMQGFRAWSFGWSAYPDIMARHPITWVNLIILPFSPICGLFYKLLKFILNFIKFKN